jgi:hypothetical protein
MVVGTLVLVIMVGARMVVMVVWAFVGVMVVGALVVVMVVMVILFLSPGHQDQGLNGQIIGGQNQNKI